MGLKPLVYQSVMHHLAAIGRGQGATTEAISAELREIPLLRWRRYSRSSTKKL